MPYVHIKNPYYSLYVGETVNSEKKWSIFVYTIQVCVK